VNAFAQPVWGHALWLALIAALFIRWAYLRRRADLERFAEPALLQKLSASVDHSRRNLKAALIVSAIVFLALTLMEPRWGESWQTVHRRGIDLFVAVDLSRSMLADDVSPSRLEKAKLELQDLLDIAEGDRIGLIGFAGDSQILCPLTADFAAVRLFMQDLDTDLIPTGGTLLSQPILQAVRGFRAAESESKALLLITDGEDNSPQTPNAVQTAKAAGVKIFIAGVGTAEGTPINLSSNPDRPDYLESEPGQIHQSRLDEDGLKQIALATDGAYRKSVGSGQALAQIYRESIATMEGSEFESDIRRSFQSRYQWPLAVAILLLMIEMLLSDRRAVRIERVMREPVR